MHLARASPIPAPAWHPGRVLRLLRESRTGRPGPLIRLLTVVLLAVLVSANAPVLIPVARWVISLL